MPICFLSVSESLTCLHLLVPRQVAPIECRFDLCAQLWVGGVVLSGLRILVADVSAAAASSRITVAGYGTDEGHRMMALLSKTTKPSASLKVGTWWFGFIDCPAYLCWGKNACLPAAAAYQKLRGHLLALRNIDVSPNIVDFRRFEKEPGAPAVRRDFHPVQMMWVPDTLSHASPTKQTL